MAVAVGSANPHLSRIGLEPGRFDTKKFGIKRRRFPLINPCLCDSKSLRCDSQKVSGRKEISCGRKGVNVAHLDVRSKDSFKF